MKPKTISKDPLYLELTAAADAALQSPDNESIQQVRTLLGKFERLHHEDCPNFLFRVAQSCIDKALKYKSEAKKGEFVGTARDYIQKLEHAYAMRRSHEEEKKQKSE